MENKTCKNCGSVLGAQQMFCTKCGTPAATEPVCEANVAPVAVEAAPEVSAAPIVQKAVCSNCGAELADGQAFCTKCGTSANKPLACGKCGAALNEGQEFCVKCGQKAGLMIDAKVTSVIDQFNENIGKKKKNKVKKIVLFTTIPAAVILLVVALVFLLREPFEGKYVSTDTESNSYYVFSDDDSYVHKTSDDTETGTYKLDDNMVKLTDDEDEDEDERIFYRDGKYIFSSTVHYDETLQSGEFVSQRLSKSYGTMYEGYYFYTYIYLDLDDDGTYRYTFGITADGEQLGDEVIHKGSYTIDGKYLTLESDEGETQTCIIKDGFVYDEVFVKEK